MYINNKKYYLPGNNDEHMSCIIDSKAFRHTGIETLILLQYSMREVIYRVLLGSDPLP